MGAGDMKIYLDDVRQAPPGWVRTHWPDEVYELLLTGTVTEVSLDHDLGDDARGTGYDVIAWIEEAMHLRQFSPPKIWIHSANSSARLRMQAGVVAIENWASLHNQTLANRRNVPRYFETK